eukprot:8570149-Pyramimonas_sp.AAC.1
MHASFSSARRAAREPAVGLASDVPAGAFGGDRPPASCAARPRPDASASWRTPARRNRSFRWRMTSCKRSCFARRSSIRAARPAAERERARGRVPRDWSACFSTRGGLPPEAPARTERPRCGSGSCLCSRAEASLRLCPIPDPGSLARGGVSKDRTPTARRGAVPSSAVLPPPAALQGGRATPAAPRSLLQAAPAPGASSLPPVCGGALHRLRGAG